MMKPITQLLKKFNIKNSDILAYGEHIAKIKPILATPKDNKKLILVTAISPTSAGEGKTTVLIGLNDALNKLKHKSIAALREPSMGPVFGFKGGANGGGKSQIIPKDEIDLHFTGDFHAITAVNNLIAACIDNHIYWGNELNIDPDKIIWRRVMDVNDRSLRDITINIKKDTKYQSGFDITAASEIMAIFCLSNNVEELKTRIQNVLVGYSKANKPIYVKDFNIIGAIMNLLTHALWPNVVQSLENNLALVHGGPFANIAHGCNSIFATKTAMNLADYVVTEAGFGSDLGGEKFFDIVCDNSKLKPNAVVLVASIRSLKLHGGCKDLYKEDETSLSEGLKNLKQHINNLHAFNVPFIVAVNSFKTDTKNENNTLIQYFTNNNIPFSFTTLFEHGSKGALELANNIVKLCKLPNKFKPIYNLNESLDKKIYKIATGCYGAIGVVYSPIAKTKLNKLKNKKAYVCVAKTPITFSDDPKEIVINKPITLHIKDLIEANGANFVIVMAGDIFRMPGLPKVPNACKM